MVSDRQVFWRSLFAAALASLAASLAVFGVVVLRPFEPIGAEALPTLDAQPPTATPTPSPGQPATGAGAPATERPKPTEPTSSKSTPADELRRAIRNALGDDTARYGVVVLRIDDGLTASINPGQQFYAASLFKLAVLYEALVRHTHGTLSFDDPVELTEEDLAEDLGTIEDTLSELQQEAPTVGECLDAMIRISDNSCAVALMRSLDEAAIDETLAAIGLEHTSVNTRDLPTTAVDMARLMEALVTGERLGSDERRYARDLLLSQAIRTGIPAGVPSQARVGNKTGTYPGSTHDVAFVEAPGGTYILAVLSEGDWAWAPIADVSAAVYDVLARE